MNKKDLNASTVLSSFIKPGGIKNLKEDEGEDTNIM